MSNAVQICLRTGYLGATTRYLRAFLQAIRESTEMEIPLHEEQREECSSYYQNLYLKELNMKSELSTEVANC